MSLRMHPWIMWEELVWNARKIEEELSTYSIIEVEPFPRDSFIKIWLDGTKLVDATELTACSDGSLHEAGECHGN